MLRQALNAAHQTILRQQAGLTTLCLAAVVPLRKVRQFAMCVVNVGDSLAFVFSRLHGMREVTTGSHDIQAERDLRDAGGAVGPVREGGEPELHNLTFSMTFVDAGDVVFLTTDGISDNFDPVVTKIAVAKKFEIASEKEASSSNQQEKTDACAKAYEENSEQCKESESSDANAPESHESQAVFATSPENTDKINDNTELAQSSACTQLGDVTQEHNSEHENQIVTSTNGNKSENDAFSKASEEPVPALSPNANTSTVQLDPMSPTDKEKTLTLVATPQGPEMLPHERHCYAVRQMEKVLHEYELATEDSIGAQEVCGVLVQHVLLLTNSKRQVSYNGFHRHQLPHSVTACL